MPIQGIEQPNIIQIDDNLRLRKYDGIHNFALKWYQIKETVMLVDGNDTPYDEDQLSRMYTYLNNIGELYFIEFLQDGKYFPIGDVTFWKDDMPIVIGDQSFRGKGIGKKVIKALICRAKELGYLELYVSEIYRYNKASRKLFESNGFVACKETQKGNSFYLKLDK